MSEEIFVSYRRSDTAALAGRIRDRLNALFPDSVFLDVDNIKPGTDFVETIQRVIRSSKVVIILIGKNWLESAEGGTRIGDRKDFVTLEAREALESKLPIIPVLVDGVSMPKEETLPKAIADLTRQNAAEIRHSHFEKDFESLALAIYGFLGIHPPTQFEQLMESVASRAGWSHFRYDEAMRSWHALIALVLGMLSAIATSLVVTGFFDNDLEFLFQTVAGIYPAIIGMNSAGNRPLALAGLGLCVASFVVQFVLWDALTVVQ